MTKRQFRKLSKAYHEFFGEKFISNFPLYKTEEYKKFSEDQHTKCGNCPALCSNGACSELITLETFECPREKLQKELKMKIQCPVCKTEVEYKHLVGSDIYLIHLKELIKDLFEWAEEKGYEIECEEWDSCLKEYLPRLESRDRLALVSYYTFAGWLDEEGEKKYELYLF